MSEKNHLEDFKHSICDDGYQPPKVSFAKSKNSILKLTLMSMASVTLKQKYFVDFARAR